ncbi:MAG: hypothetical protein ACTHM8_04220 [Sphingomonas sp.]
MNDTDAVARKRYFAMLAVRLAGTAGAVFGLFLLGRSDHTVVRVLGIAIVLSALLMIALVPRSLAHRWRTPPE